MDCCPSNDMSAPQVTAHFFQESVALLLLLYCCCCRSYKAFTRCSNINSLQPQ